MRFATAALALATSICACTDDTPSPADSGEATDGAVPIDSSTHHDADLIEDAGDHDSGAADAGQVSSTSFEPGSHVEVEEGRVQIGATFAQTKAAIGAPTRMSPASGAAQPRSYEWDLTSGPHLVVWFADTDLSGGAIDETDKALWVAVEGSFTGRSTAGIGLGSTKAQVRAAYGTVDLTGTVADPPGEVDAWYTKGLLAAYQPDGILRTITVARSYVRAPNALIDIAGGKLDFPPAIQGGAILASEPADVETILGTPDGEGNVSPGGTALHAYSYAFIGIEVFFTAVLGTERAAFVTVHAPFYGLTSNGIGIGSSRADFESHLTSLGFDAGRATSASAELFCYVKEVGGRPQRGIAATFSAATPPLVTTINVGFPPQACQ
ncbi:MAG: hypothetical protein HYV07_20135 [Deltaproteobacteria bacterium]|nr:hypothetical protein [Deltaproteobacteria bacterium]